MRNFWIVADIDGRSQVATGPRSKDGGFDLTVRVKSEGESVPALEVRGRVQLSDGTLSLVVENFAREQVSRQIFTP